MKRKILSLFLVMAVLTTCITIPTFAEPVVYDVSVNGDGSVTATYDPDTYTMIISGTGAMKDYNNKVSNDCVPYYNNLASMKKIIVEEGITHIGTNAFYAYYSYYRDNYWASSVTELSLPSTLESIGKYAFQGLGRGVETFDLVIPEGVTLIDDLAFCSAFSSSTNVVITLPSSLKTIGDSAFAGIGGISEIIIPEGVETLEMSVFSGVTSLTDITIPSTVTSMGDSVFYGCTNVENFTLNSSDLTVTSYLFGQSTNVMGYNKTEKIASIPASQYYIISSLEALGYTVNVVGEEVSEEIKWTSYPNDIVYDIGVDGDNVKGYWNPYTKEFDVVGLGAMGFTSHPYFTVLGSINKVNIHEGVTEICANAFYHSRILSGSTSYYKMSAATEVNIASSVTKIGNSAFYNGSYTTVNFAENSQLNSIGTSVFASSNLSKINLEDTHITEISGSLFSGCDDLTNIELPFGVTSIGNSAFAGSGLTNIDFLEGIESIGDSAFSSIDGITDITIPSTVKNIGSNAFNDCYAVKTVEYNAINASLGSSIFGTTMGKNATNKSATVPKSQRYIIESLTELGYNISTYGEDSSNVSASYPTENVWSVGAEGDNIIALYNDTTKTLYLEGSGKMMDYNYYHWNSSSTNKIPYQYKLGQIKTIIMDDDITHIGSYAFFTKDVGRTNSSTSPLQRIEEIKFPKNLKSIGSNAFDYMNEYYRSITVDIILPEGLEVIENGFNMACIRTLVIPSTVTEMTISPYAVSTVVNKIKTDQSNSISKVVGTEVYLYSTNTSLLTAAQSKPLDSDKIHFLDNPATSGVLENGITWTYDPDTQTLTFDTTDATSTEIPSYTVGYQPWYACSYHYGAPRTYGFGGVTGIGSGALMGLDYGSVGNIDYYGNSSLGGAITSQTGVPTTYGGSSNPNTDSDLGGSGGGGSTGNDPSQNPSDDTSETGIWVYVDDVEVDFPDVQPRVWFGEVYAPLRFINQDLGAKVLWNNESRTATIQRTTANGSKVEIELTVGSSSMVVNGKEYTSEEIGMEATVLFENGRLLLPGRAIVKAWDDVFFKNVYTATAYKDYYYYQDDGESEDKLEEVPEIDNFVSNGVEITPDNEEEVLSDYGETKILVNAESTFFFVSTPILVSVYMDSTGNVAVSDNLYIENKCASGPVIIEEIKVIKANQWELRNYTTFDFKNALADSKFIGLEINGVTVGEDGSVIMNEDLYSSILHSESKELEINAKLPAQRKAIKEIGAGIIFTVDFDKYGE